MSLKRGLGEAKTHLYRTFTLLRNAGIDLHQKTSTRQFTYLKIFRSTKQKNQVETYSSKVTRSLPIIDSGQRSLHTTFNTKSEKLTAISQLEQDEPEHLVIEPPVSHEEVMACLKDCSSVEEQMNRLGSILKLRDEDIEKRISICDDVKSMLQPFFEDFKVQLYGSSINGFGFKGCDIDMSFTTSVEPEDMMVSARDDSYIPPLEDVLSGKISPKHISRLSSKDQLLFIHFVFLDFYKDSTTTPLYIAAYVPIIRFQNDKYNLKCDLSAGNRRALGNTKLLYLYGKLDKRVMPLMMTIRYWAKHVGLIGSGLTFNTYTITLLLVYFLQTRNPPVLPTAEYIFSVADSVTSSDVYDKGIIKDIEKIPPSENTESVEELFREFFFYYFYFDFTRVISPLKAIAVPREEFSASETNKRFRLNTICVQDPIKLSHNVANLVDYKHCRKFGREMLMACKALQERTFSSPNGDNWGLLRLLNQPQENIHFHDEVFWNFQVPLPLTASESNGQPLQRLSDLVLKIFKRILLFECEVLQNTDVEDLSDEKHVFSMKCKGIHNTWLGRNCAQPDEDLTDPFEKERNISLKVSDRLKNEKQKEFSFFCRGYAVSENNQLSLHIKLIPTGKTELSPVLGIFLKEYVPKMVRHLW